MTGTGRMNVKSPQEQVARKYFDDRAATYRAEIYDSPLRTHYQLLLRRRQVIVEAMLRPMRGPSLELGCGPGVFVPALSAIGPVFPGDLSLAMTRQARDTYGANTAAQLSAAALPFRSESFEVVTAAGVLEYVSDEAAVLAEIHRVLRPEGRAIITFPASKPFEHWLRRTAGAIVRPAGRTPGPSRREGEHTFREARDLLERAGFVVEQAESFHYFYFPMSRIAFGASRLIDRVLTRAQQLAPAIGRAAQSWVFRVRKAPGGTGA